MKKSDILTVEQIQSIKDLNKLNQLIKQYERELNRRMRILQKYSASDPQLYKKAMGTFQTIAGRPGFSVTKISSPETQNIIIAQSRLKNLANVLRGENTQIRSLRAAQRRRYISLEKGVYRALNKNVKIVTHKQLKSLTSEDWREIRSLLEEYQQYISGDVIDTYIESNGNTDLEEFGSMLKNIAMRNQSFDGV